MKNLVDKLYKTHNLSENEFLKLLNNRNDDIASYLSDKARQTALSVYGNKIYIRGLLEITNYCKNDCYYCGIRHSNPHCERFRLSADEIYNCCENGYNLGFRTFVMQGGENGGYSDDELTKIVSHIRKKYPDCAITLSVGEKSKQIYQQYFDAGANRYLLRHETADDEHYKKLHPKEMSLAHRKQCLFDLKDIGYQVGTGIMVGSPFQTNKNIVHDLLFMKTLNPQMIGIGPFVSQKDTPFHDKKNGSAELTCYLLSILRLMFPNALIPATTALGTIKQNGREKGILSGANVIMPNLSPVSTRKKYLLYDNKLATGLESCEGLEELRQQIKSIGYKIVCDRGDYKL